FPALSLHRTVGLSKEIVAEGGAKGSARARAVLAILPRRAAAERGGRHDQGGERCCDQDLRLHTGLASVIERSISGQAKNVRKRRPRRTDLAKAGARRSPCSRGARARASTHRLRRPNRGCRRSSRPRAAGPPP